MILVGSWGTVYATAFGLQSSKAISSTGCIGWLVSLNSTNVVGFNALSLGFQCPYGALGHSELRQLAKDAKFKIVRFFDSSNSPSISSVMPCIYFNETTRTGTYNWTTVDDVVEKILIIGAEPLVCLGVFPTGGGPPKVPLGMTINSTTNLPNPESYATYAAEWVKHFKAKGWNVRFYEILNEPAVYFGSLPVDYTKLQYYALLFDACRNAMKKENSSIIVSFDCIHKKNILDPWLTYGGPDVDSLNFHKYDDWKLPPQYTDEEMFAAAERLQAWYSIVEAEQVWYRNRGEHLPMICSESNFNGASPNGTTDLRIQQMVGAVWLALLLRTEILFGVSYHVYFELNSGYYADSYGFGMINNDFKPWYPYFVQKWLGNNLAVGDSIINSSSSSVDVRPLAWIHQGTLNVLLINKVNQTRAVYLRGITVQMNLSKIDNTIPWTVASVQTDVVDSSQPLIMYGYTVALLQITIPPS